MEEYEIDHIRRVRKISPECMVLLKKDDSFPLDGPCPIALYGNAARKTIKGGTGSGDVNVRHYPSIEEGLRNAGFTITSESWLDAYDQIYAREHRKFTEGIKAKIAAEGLKAIMLGIGAIMDEPDYDLPLQGTGDTAIYVLGRISGEGSDRSPEKGNLLLTDTEVRDILALQKKYPRFMLVLNTGGVVDLSPVVDAVSNILLISQLGSAIGDAFADVLLGKAYPSGKLSATWARWNDDWHIGDFGNPDDTRYREGIYVGYRYFDTTETDPLFPFGYGLGYTDFSISHWRTEVDGDRVTIHAEVTDTGRFPGREVVQLYVSVPEGKLDQPYQALAAFVKTDELKPGEIQDVSLSFCLEEIASFDAAAKCAILEKGDYVLHIGSSSRDTSVCAVIRLDQTVVVQQLHDAGGNPDFADWKPRRRKQVAVPSDTPVFTVNGAQIRQVVTHPPVIDPEALKKAESMPDRDLALLCTGAYDGGVGSNNVIGSAGITVAGSAGETTGIFSDIPALIMADGPAGVRIAPRYGKDEKGVYPLDSGSISQVAELIPEQMLAALGLNHDESGRRGEVHEQWCTAIPIGTALAQSWNISVCEECGDIVAQEMEKFGIQIWLAPALNIQRVPLCGRNFEYYSEDPLLSGKMAAAVTRGVQSHSGCGVSIKHFCCNNQETNRMHSNSQVSQRALREIYLRGFHIAVAESSPATIMSSYNLLNGEHTCQRKDLLETILRKEWGYEGIVMSDWISGNFNSPDNKYPGVISSKAVSAGNDLMMPGTEAHYKDLMMSSKRCDLERAAARMISLAWRLQKKNRG